MPRFTSGLTANYNNYSAAALEAALQSWVEPYPKPIILNHNLDNEPIGRVMAAKMDKESDGSAYVRLQIAITDPLAIEKVLDKRYLTGSVGGRAGKAICSISGEDLAAESEGGRPKLPKYKRGQVYKGKLAFVDMQDISFKEYSFVNQPADGKSGVRSTKSVSAGVSDSQSDDWVAKSSAFIINMSEEDIVSVKENKSILKKMKPKESKPMYLHLKGAFLSAFSIQESENYSYKNNSLLSPEETEEIDNSQENEKMENSEVQEDILAVAEELSNSLSSIAVASSEDNTPVEESTEQSPEAKEGESPEASDQEEPAAEESSSEDENKVSEEDEEQAEEQVVETVDSEVSESSEERPEDVQVDSKEDASSDQSLSAEADKSPEFDKDEISKKLDSIKSLEEENIKLKKALHRTLVERVVDAKISVGLESVENREKSIEEHASRTASSLADSLRDMAKLPQAKQPKAEMPDISSDTEVVESEQNVITLDSEEKAEPVDTVEQLFVDALMGRRKL